MTTRRHFLSLASVAAATSALGWGRLALAQANVTKLIVGFQAGGGFDGMARILADQLQRHGQQHFIVENKPGAAGRLAVDTVRRSAPDGATLLVTPSPVLTLAPHTEPDSDLAFDPLRDLVTVARLASFDYGFAVNGSLNIATLQEYIDAAHNNAKVAAYGSPGVGLTPHLVGMILGRETGVDLLHVPYKGTAPALQDAMGNQIPAVCATAPALAAAHKSGRIRVLATTGAERNADLPDVPTFTESGLDSLTIEDWAVLSAPAGTPDPVVQALSQAVLVSLADSGLQQQFKQQGFYPAGLSASAAASLLASDFAKWKELVAAVGFKGH